MRIRILKKGKGGDGSTITKCAGLTKYYIKYYTQVLLNEQVERALWKYIILF